MLLQTELLRTDQQGFLKELDENLLSRQPSESSIPVKRWRRCVECCHACCLYRAAFGFTCTMSLLVLGLVLLMVTEVAFEGNDDCVMSKQIFNASGFFIAMGFFGTFSGITNLLANVALFYGIPYLPGIGSVAVVHTYRFLVAVTNAVCSLAVLNKLILFVSSPPCVRVLCVV